MPTKTTTASRRSAVSQTAGDPLALEEQVCFALAVANRSVLRIYRPLLEPLGLTHPQYLVMLALWQSTPLSVKELGARLQLDSGTLSPLLKRLEAVGLVGRERDPSDERSVSVSLTAGGRALREDALRIPGQVVQTLGMDLAELHRMRRTLTAVIEAADRAAPALSD